MRELGKTGVLMRLDVVIGVMERIAIENSEAEYAMLDMNWFGLKVEYDHSCGTSACAAGWCALDADARKAFGLAKKTITPETATAIASDDGSRISHRWDDMLPDRYIALGYLFGMNLSMIYMGRELGLTYEDDDRVTPEMWLDVARILRDRVDTDQALPRS